MPNSQVENNCTFNKPPFLVMHVGKPQQISPWNVKYALRMHNEKSFKVLV